MLSRALNLTAHPAGQHHPDHFVVAHEGPERILKCRWLILFDEEMTNPGRTISGYQSQREKPPPSNRNEVNHAAERDGGSDQVEQTRGALTVLSHIVGPKLGE